MEHVTACYWQKETPAELFLSLQQRKYRRLGISVVCACISDNGELVRSLQNKMEEELEEDFLNTVTVQLAFSVLEGVLSPSVTASPPVTSSPSA